jgi:broad specificity phosphatase PhoE
VLVIAHRAVLRALYGYFLQIAPTQTPLLPMPLHTVIQVTPTAYGCEEERVELEPRVEPLPQAASGPLKWPKAHPK